MVFIEVIFTKFFPGCLEKVQSKFQSPVLCLTFRTPHNLLQANCSKAFCTTNFSFQGFHTIQCHLNIPQLLRSPCFHSGVPLPLSGPPQVLSSSEILSIPQGLAQEVSSQGTFTATQAHNAPSLPGIPSVSCCQDNLFQHLTT